MIHQYNLFGKNKVVGTTNSFGREKVPMRLLQKSYSAYKWNKWLLLLKYSPILYDRIYGFKLTAGELKSDVRKHYFTERIVEAWYKLPTEVIGQSSVIEFKHAWDKHMSKFWWKFKKWIKVNIFLKNKHIKKKTKTNKKLKRQTPLGLVCCQFSVSMFSFLTRYSQIFWGCSGLDFEG